MLTDKTKLLILLITPIFHGSFANLSWRLLQPVDFKSPPARKHFALSYEPSQNLLIAFGGIGENQLVLQDTWVYDVAQGLGMVFKLLKYSLVSIVFSFYQ